MSYSPDIEKVLHLFACPGCNDRLTRTANGLNCNRCKCDYGLTSDGRLDLRLKKPKAVKIDFNLEVNPFREPDYPRLKRIILDPIRKERHPRFTKYYYSSIPKASSTGQFCLDLGCGPMEKRRYYELAGYEYVGFDPENAKTPIVADGHAIPFLDNSFDLVATSAVFEHLRHPWIVAREIHRILKPGGRFHGWVAFIEGFHWSYYHMSHWAIGSLLESAGFEVEWLEPDSSNLAFIMNDLFPRIPRLPFEILSAPLYLLHRIYWKVGSLLIHTPATEESFRNWKIPGGIMFQVRKSN